MSDKSLRLIEQGIDWQRKGFRSHAERMYRRVPPSDRYYADALNLLGTVRFEEGKPEEAAKLLETAVRTGPGNATAWNNLGSVSRHLGRSRVSLACLRRAMMLSPGRLDTAQGMAEVMTGHARSRWLKRRLLLSPLDEWPILEIGNDLAKAGRLSAAARQFRRLVAAQPAAWAPLFNLGNTLRDLGSLEDAERQYRRSLSVSPRQGNVLNNLGLLSYNRSDWPFAEQRFAAASRASPGLAAAWLNRARALQKLGRHLETVALYQRGLLIEPNNVAACCEIAGQLEDRRWATRALALDPRAPQPYNRLALLATKDAGRAGVLCWLRRGAVAKPDDPDAWYNIGVELGRDGDPAAAVRYGTFATRVRDSHALAHLNTALALLALERFREGWSAHTRRLESPDAAPHRRFFAIRQWSAESLRGRTLLLWGEQGIGDEVQFLTLVPHLLRLGARLTILTEQRLRPIIKRSFPGVSVPVVSFPRGAVEDHHGADFHLALGDLPHRLGLFCGGEVAPEPWIVPDREQVAALRAGLQARHPGKRLVGITWRSIAPKTGARRTIAPALWGDVLSAPNIAAVSLQYDTEEADIAAFSEAAGAPVDGAHGVEPLIDLDGLAALVEAVDLVICPANNTVHFAGALSKSCWTLVPTRPDWRWGLGRDDSLWYPRTRVYRQSEDDDWRPVMQTVARDVHRWSAP